MQYRFPTRKKEAHKGEVGKVIVVGGSKKYYGAPILSAMGVENAGADLITLFLPGIHSEAAKRYSLNLFLCPYQKDHLSLEDLNFICDSAKGADALLIGPGLGDLLETQNAVIDLLKRITIPIVIDAQALFPRILESKRHSEWVLTPHKKEFQRLFDCDATVANIKYMAQKHNVTILVKSVVDIISDNQGKVVENKHGCPEMRVGGTGDVLAGIIASWIAQGMAPFDACANAVYYFCSAAEDLHTKKIVFSARDLVHYFSYYLAQRGAE